MNEWYAEPKKEKWYKRLKCYWNFESQIKSMWLTGYLLITWEWDDNHPFWESLDFSWYSSGSYE